MVNDDLQHHAVGCYTAESEIKKGNRQSEAALVTAEKITAIGSMAWGAKYPMKEFTTAWQKVLFLQFHDSLAGTSVPEHCQHAREGYGYALETAHQTTYYAVQKLESMVPSEDPESQYLVAFNPNAWEVTGNIEYDFSWNLKTTSKVEDESGKSLPHQWIAGSTETGNRTKTGHQSQSAAARLSSDPDIKGRNACNYRCGHCEGKLLENEFLRVSFSFQAHYQYLIKSPERNFLPEKIPAAGH